MSPSQHHARLLFCSSACERVELRRNATAGVLSDTRLGAAPFLIPRFDSFVAISAEQPAWYLGAWCGGVLASRYARGGESAYALPWTRAKIEGPVRDVSQVS